MTYQERDTFVRAVRMISGTQPGGDGSNYLAYTRSLHEQATNLGVHNSGLFLPWHRFFLLDYNLKINALGGEFACLGIPYWDYSKVSVTANGINNLLTDMFTNKKSNGLWIGVGLIDGCTAYSAGHPFAIQTTNAQFYYACSTCYINGASSSCCYWYINNIATTSSWPGTWQWNAYTGAWTWAATIAQSGITRSTAIYTAARANSSSGGPGGSQQQSSTAIKTTSPASSGAYYSQGAWAAYGPYNMYYQILAATNYADFNARVNAYGHQAIHVWVGAGMGILNGAANDPIFFMLHAFVDLLWAAWQACNGLTPCKDSDIANANPMIWNWAGTVPFSGSNAYMPLYPSRTPKDAHDVTALGYQYTPGFISNVVNLANSSWCSVRSAGFSSFLQAQERATARHAITTDLNNPPRVVATSLLEQYTSGNSVPQQQGHRRQKKISGAKRLKLQAAGRGTLAKPGCYAPKQDEITNLKYFGAVYKKVQRTSGDEAALQAVKDAECNAMEYQSGQVAPDSFIRQMGLDAVKARAKGLFTHQCFLKQQETAKANSLKSEYQKGLEKSGKHRKPRRQKVNQPAPKFYPLEDFPPPSLPPSAKNSSSAPSYSSYSRFLKRNTQNQLSPF